MTQKEKEWSSFGHYMGWNREIREKQRQRNTLTKVRERREGTGMGRVMGPEAGEIRGSCNETPENR